jgi:UDP-N-acetylglucosamine diphosphorylase/glucosamine-1-phosphate N-acetyltransferase
MILLYDTPTSRAQMYPLSLTRPVCDLRYGILTIREHWILKTGAEVLTLTEDYLQESIPSADFYICADPCVLADDACFEKILSLQVGEMLEDELGMIAYSIAKPPMFNQLPVWLDKSYSISSQKRLGHASELIKTNAARIATDFALLSTQKASASIDASNTIIGPSQVFIEDGADVKACIINATEGPVYIGAHALLMEGTLIRGPVAICHHAVIKMGTRLYPGTSIGPYCTAGGEIKNSILSGYSNKAHDGYLGDSLLGEWCNMGAGSSNSNVKNTAGEVKMWSEAENKMIAVGNKAGLIMGDYSRTAINSSINTGTTIGVSCNVYEGTYPPKHLPSFGWGNYETYAFEKACADAANWKKMKGREFTETDRRILQHIFEKRNTIND